MPSESFFAVHFSLDATNQPQPSRPTWSDWLPRIRYIPSNNTDFCPCSSCNRIHLQHPSTTKTIFTWIIHLTHEVFRHAETVCQLDNLEDASMGTSTSGLWRRSLLEQPPCCLCLFTRFESTFVLLCLSLCFDSDA